MITEPVCLDPVSERRIHLSKWSSRFWAWLVDIILVILFLNTVCGIFEPFWRLPLLWDYEHREVVAIGFETVFFILYRTVMEGVRGQSIGKMMNLNEVNRDGSEIHYGTSAIKAIGKAFLLPLDCRFGWLAMPNT